MLYVAKIKSPHFGRANRKTKQNINSQETKIKLRPSSLLVALVALVADVAAVANHAR